MESPPQNTAIPVLPTLDLSQTAHFYKHALGFKVQSETPYTSAKRDGIELRFQRCDNMLRCEHTSCYIRVEDADDWYIEFFRKGVIHPDHHIEEKSWGMREFAIMDNMDNTLWFGERVRKSNKNKQQTVS